MRSPRSFWSSSISAAPARACSRIGYGTHEKSPERVLPFYPAFLAGMNLVVLADDAFTFLVSWEFMSLTSWALVMAHHHDPENRRAGYIYILMASFGTLALLLAFGLLAGGDGGYAFADDARSATAALPGLVLVLALIGAGSKAGLVPLHVWLPLAHPAAPSHVSALMSGVMTKVAVYGFIRIVFDLLGPPAWWWSIVVIALAGITCVLGVLERADAARPEAPARLSHGREHRHHLHRPGPGARLLGPRHAGAGGAGADRRAVPRLQSQPLQEPAVLRRRRRADRDGRARHGASRRPHPSHAAHRLRVPGRCMAISALPPLNGFVSEWLTFQAILLSPDVPSWGIKLIVPAVGAMLALSAALAAACFVKAFGVTFLGRPRTPAAAQARGDRPRLARRHVRICRALPARRHPSGLRHRRARAGGAGLVGGRMPAQAALPWLSIVPIGESRSSYNGLLVFVFITISTLAAVEIIHRFASRARAARRRPGTAASRIRARPPNIRPAASPSRSAGSSARSCSRHASASTCRRPATRGRRGSPSTHRDLVWDVLYAPIGAPSAFAADKLNRLQFLTIRQFLSLVFAALVGCSSLVACSVWP